jgi:hypothetical protein
VSLLGEKSSRLDGEFRATRRPVSWAEEAMRNGVEAFYRERCPDARIVHELVMSRGSVRADVCAVAPAHFVAAEIKSQYDSTDRLINQAAMFRLASPELWLFADERHHRDCKIITYLMPSIGYALCQEIELRVAANEARAPAWKIEREAAMFRPDPEALLSLLWVAELTREALAARIITPPGSKPFSHAALVKRFIDATSEADMLAVVCRALRSRVAEWRADPPIDPGVLA